MFEDLGFAMDLGPIELKDLGEEHFEDAVFAEDAEGFALAGLGEADALARLVVEPILALEGFDHGGGGAGDDLQPFGHLAHGDVMVWAGFGEGVNPFEIIFDGGRRHDFSLTTQNP